jgi:hypothetical protein
MINDIILTLTTLEDKKDGYQYTFKGFSHGTPFIISGSSPGWICSIFLIWHFRSPIISTAAHYCWCWLQKWTILDPPILPLFREATAYRHSLHSPPVFSLPISCTIPSRYS